MISPTVARKLGREMVELDLLMITLVHAVAPPAKFGGGGPRLGSAATNTRATWSGASAAATSAPAEFVGLATGLGPQLTVGGRVLRRSLRRRTRTCGARWRTMPSGSKSAKRLLREAWRNPAGTSSRRRSACSR